jgi:hypothetical protein
MNNKLRLVHVYRLKMYDGTYLAHAYMKLLNYLSQEPLELAPKPITIHTFVYCCFHVTLSHPCPTNRYMVAILHLRHNGT